METTPSINAGRTRPRPALVALKWLVLALLLSAAIASPTIILSLTSR